MLDEMSHLCHIFHVAYLLRSDVFHPTAPAATSCHNRTAKTKVSPGSQVPLPQVTWAQAGG
jgi:hypothetical protein